MRRRRLLAAMTTAALLVAGTATAATAAPNRLVALWKMNERAGSRTMHDSSGNGLNGVIGAEVQAGVSVGDGTGYRFSKLQPDTPPTHPQHVAVVPNYGLLNPGDSDFAVTLRLRTTYQFGNIVQKGQATVAGGNFKLQIPNGIVQCIVRGSDGSIAVSASQRINNGAWHVVQCERYSDEVVLSIDGAAVAHRYGWTGRIENNWPLSIGGKTGCDQRNVGCDYFAGDIDYVKITD
ncbi:MAG: hypothetical protein QOE51_525 [Actinoplanes sp.]|nr:hypothetical protein [Actinoplanes sp.]